MHVVTDYEADTYTLNFVESKIKEDVPGFELKFKAQGGRLSRFLMKIDAWARTYITLYPKVWAPSIRWVTDHPLHAARVLQHEWVHLKDAMTLFGLLPRKLKWFNVPMFYILYLMPQLFATVALLAPFTSWWLLLALLCLIPMPSPFRMFAEMRAYRRSRELGVGPEHLSKAFSGTTYWYMWPFKKWVEEQLQKPSPYKTEMDEVWGG